MDYKKKRVSHLTNWKALICFWQITLNNCKRHIFTNGTIPTYFAKAIDYYDEA